MDLRDQGIAVFCGSSPSNRPEFLHAAAELGRCLAERGAFVVYGGASVGLMGAVADAALQQGGRVVGVIPHQLVAREIAHAGLTELQVVDSMHTRKARMSELAAGYVALPGGYGTFEELFEVITWRQLGLHGKPIVVLNLDGYYDPLLAQIDRAVACELMRPALREYVLVARNVVEALALLETYVVPERPLGKWI